MPSRTDVPISQFERDEVLRCLSRLTHAVEPIAQDDRLHAIRRLDAEVRSLESSARG